MYNEYNEARYECTGKDFPMKKCIRSLALISALLCSLSLLVACQSDPTETTEGTEPLTSGQTAAESVAEALPNIEKTDYASDFIMHIMPDVNRTEYHWVKKSAGDALSEEIYKRQEQVRAHLGVNVLAVEAEDHTAYTEPIKTAIKNKDDSVQMIITHVHSGISGLINGNYLADLKDVPGIDLEADYWTRDFMEDLELADKMLLGNNRFNILRTYVISFNKTMMAQYEDAMDSTVYELVNEHKWTLDQMIGLAERVYIDTTSDGKTEDDTFGLTGVQWVPFCGFLQAADINLIDRDESGAYVVSVLNEVNKDRTAILIDKLSALASSEYAWFKYRVEPTPEIGLQSGRALMTLIGTDYLPGLCEYDDLVFGVLPYPMFDETQKEAGYRHLQWGGYTCVPSYVADFKMVGETVELLAYYSAPVNTAFYEKMLGKQVADVPEDRRMLDIVWATICSDFGQAYSDVGTSALYLVPELTDPNGTLQLASYVKSKETAINKAIQKFVARAERQQ